MAQSWFLHQVVIPFPLHVLLSSCFRKMCFSSRLFQSMEFLRPAAMTNFNNGSLYEALKKPITSSLDESEAPSVGFECNICLDLVQDPVEMTTIVDILCVAILKI